MQYNRAMFFTKKANLHDYLCTDRVIDGQYDGYISPSIRDSYEREREIQLIALLRWEDRPVSTRRGFVNRPVCYCKIKCPINPMPIRGEFELASITALHKFLKANGWVFHKAMNTGLFE